MKTADEVEKVIKQNNDFINENLETMKSSQIKKLKSQNEDLKQIVLYLMTGPNESFIISEAERLSKIIESKNEQFEYWAKCAAPQGMKESSKRTAFGKEHGLDLIRKQLKMLNFILDK